MYSTHLYQKAATGRMKHLVVTAGDGKLITEWWTSSNGVDGKKQSTVETIQDTDERAQFEFERKVRRKTEEGYRDSIETAEAMTGTAEIEFELPQEFAPCKPISELASKQNPFDGSWLAERKHNGACILLHNADGQEFVYSRRMWNITDIVTVVREVEDALHEVPENSLYIAELTAYDANGKEDTGVLKGVMNERTIREKAQERYDNLIAEGFTFAVRVFDVFFNEGEDVTMRPFTERREITESVYGPRDIQVFTKQMEVDAMELGWEGYVLRQADAQIEFSMNGKPRRAGSYKYKFVYEADVIIVGAEAGNGKNENRYAVFNIAQLLPDGTLLSCGNMGPGKLGEEKADDLTREFLAKGYGLKKAEFRREDWVVAEINYQSRHKLNAQGQRCFEFPTVTRIRFDKPVEECIYEGASS